MAERFHNTFQEKGRLDLQPPKTKMTMENPPFEHVFPIEHGDFPLNPGWLISRDPYFMVYEIILKYNWVGCHPVYSK